VIPSKILRIAGNLEAIRREYIFEIIRESHTTQNTLIEKLLEYGYKQSDYSGESATYKREGSIVRIWRDDIEYMIEYFDEMIESIVEASPRGRLHRERIVICPLHTYISESDLSLSEVLVTTLRDMPTLLIGCEFLREREYLLANILSIREFSSVSREESLKIDIQREKIETLPAFLEYIESHKNSGIL
jgi:hypothetical protein